MKLMFRLCKVKVCELYRVGLYGGVGTYSLENITLYNSLIVQAILVYVNNRARFATNLHNS